MHIPNLKTIFTTGFTAHNPSGMTLAGTNTYLVAAPTSDSAILVDPGEESTQEEHAHAIREHLQKHGQRLELILVTHHHHDHTGAVDYFHRTFDVPVRAGLETWTRDGDVLTDGEVIEAAGVEIQALHTPGHTSDHFSFYLPGDSPTDQDAVAGGSVLTGDTILGVGTTMMDFPDGDLVSYLESMQRLADLGRAGAITVLPAHGPQLESVSEIAEKYRAHRLERVEQMSQILGGIDKIVTPVEADSPQVRELAARLYPDLPDVVRIPAERTIAAGLDYLVRTAAR